MFGELVQHVSGRCDGVGTQVQFQTCLFGSCNETVGSGLIARDVHVTSGHLVLRLDAIYVGHATVRVVSIVITRLDDLDVGLCHTRLLGKFLAQEVEGNLQVAVEEPAYQSQGKHVAALHDALHVHAAVLQAVLHHRGEGTGNDTVWINTQFTEVVLRLEGCLLQVLGTEGVCVDDDGCIGLGVFELGLQGCGIHGHQHVAQVTRRINLTSTDVNLKTRHSRQ